MAGFYGIEWLAFIISFTLIPQDPKRPDKGYNEKELAISYPKTYAYSKRFQEVLSTRSGYKKFLEPQGEPFYALYDIGAYTFSPYKVVWMRISDRIKAAVDDNRSAPDNGGVTFVSFQDPIEAHYFCALFNSRLFEFAVSSFSVAGTGTWGSPHILRHIKIPSYSHKNPTHGRLAELSQQAHAAMAVANEELVEAIEAEIDNLAAEVWGISGEGLQEIQENMAELH